jgi:hypothetical protein
MPEFGADADALVTTHQMSRHRRSHPLRPETIPPFSVHPYGFIGAGKVLQVLQWGMSAATLAQRNAETSWTNHMGRWSDSAITDGVGLVSECFMRIPPD